MRKSKPSWTILGEHEIWSTVLRVPITFPPEQFHGAQLSAMCTPDLLGSQGTFFLYTTRPADAKFKEGGIRVGLPAGGDRFQTSVKGPENAFLEGKPPLEAPMSIVLDRAARRARVQLDGTAVDLREKELSDWLTLTFKAAPGIKVSANCRMMVTEMDEHFSLYVTPLNIDPEHPAMPISHPSYYATYLAKRIGPFCTLGLAEDTWALNEGVIDDAAFLKQAYDIDRERERMFFVALDKLRKGTLTCVFDGVDRIQHMFWRYFEKDHPAARGANGREHKDAIEKIYRQQRRARGQGPRPARQGRPADGPVRPRLRFLPSRREPQRLAALEGLAGPEGGRRRLRRVAARRGLVEDEGLCDRAHRACSSTSRGARPRESSSPARTRRG